jgi:hypothetical protein
MWAEGVDCGAAQAEMSINNHELTKDMSPGAELYQDVLFPA